MKNCSHQNVTAFLEDQRQRPDMLTSKLKKVHCHTLPLTNINEQILT